MLDKVKPYAKAIIAFLGAVLMVVGPEFADNDDAQRWIRIATGVLTAAGVFFVPNADPLGTHQQESTQPPHA